MSVFGTEAVALRDWSDAERLSALKRIVSKRVVATLIGRIGKNRRCCPKAPDWFMVWFVIGIGLFCNDCYRQVYRWLMRWSKQRPVPIRSTLCEARQRLGARIMVLLQREVVKLLADTRQTPTAFYRGMRLMALDGFVLNLPDTPANDHALGRPGTDRAPGAFPQARVLALCEAGTHVLWRVLIKHLGCGEITMAGYLLRQLQTGMLLLWDRNFFSYDHVRQVLGAGAHLLARIKVKSPVLLPIQRLADGSYLARIYSSRYDRKQDRRGILVRVICYTLNDPARSGHGEKHRLLTTLLDPKLHPAQTLIELYHVRWEQELSIDEFKTHEMERTVLRSQTPAGVVQEIYGLLLAHYIVRTLMYQAANSNNAEQSNPLRLSFTGTLKILRCRLPEFPRGRQQQRRWWEELIEEIAQETIPSRRNRINPRVIKQKMSKWKKKRPEHLSSPQPTKAFSRSIVLLAG
jgi:Transposase DDE domain/Insertion element 4 transposase N-terminal